MWNQIPVTLGNIVGGLVFTGMALQLTYRKRAPLPAAASIVHGPDAGRSWPPGR